MVSFFLYLVTLDQAFRFNPVPLPCRPESSPSFRIKLRLATKVLVRRSAPMNLTRGRIHLPRTQRRHTGPRRAATGPGGPRRPLSQRSLAAFKLVRSIRGACCSVL